MAFTRHSKATCRTLQYDAGKVPNAITAFRLVRQFAGDWPVFAQEVTWEASTKLNPDQVRRGAWGVAMAGGIVNYAEMFEGPHQGKPANYGDGGAFPYLSILFDFMVSLGDDRLQPHPELVGPGQLCLARPGAEYVCYTPDGAEIQVDLTAGSRTYAVQWLNPRTGDYLAGADIHAGGAQRFRPPFAGEAVLHLKAP